jgi:hypothetical protein
LQLRRSDPATLGCGRSGSERREQHGEHAHERQA